LTITQQHDALAVGGLTLQGMSQPVNLDALRDRIAEYGGSAFLITVNEHGTPHVVSVALRYRGEHLSGSVGRRTKANLARNPALTLLWPPGPDPAFSMIVDAMLVSVDTDGSGPIVVEPRSAILHRVAEAGDGPTCLPIAEPASRD
jgi:hypothetical protein